LPWLDANRLAIYYERLGRGQPLLVIPGTGADLRKPPSVLDTPLATQFDLATYDQRGLGQSDKPDGPYSIADYASDAAAVIDLMGWSRAHVLGISFGGMVAQELAIRYPQRVHGLVLCCTTPGGAGGCSYPLHTLEALTSELKARHLIPIRDLRRSNAWASEHPQEYDALLRAAMSDPFAHESRHSIGRSLQLQARARHDAWDRLALIRAPTLICGGRYDGVAPLDAQQRMSAAIAGAKLQLFEGGHQFMWEDPSAFVAMGAFLAGLPGANSGE
jgi:3-oxoadipate enol-lactonase